MQPVPSTTYPVTPRGGSPNVTVLSSALPLKLSDRLVRVGLEPTPLGLFARVKAVQPCRIVAILYLPLDFGVWCYLHTYQHFAPQRASCPACFRLRC